MFFLTTQRTAISCVGSRHCENKLIENNQEKCFWFLPNQDWHCQNPLETFTCKIFLIFLSMRLKHEKKSIFWLIRKHAFCWHSVCRLLLFVVCPSAHLLIWKVRWNFQMPQTAAAWENVVDMLRCLHVTFMFVYITTLIIFLFRSKFLQILNEKYLISNFFFSF